jgi:hypothetical protein
VPPCSKHNDKIRKVKLYIILTGLLYINYKSIHGCFISIYITKHGKQGSATASMQLVAFQTRCLQTSAKPRVTTQGFARAHAHGPVVRKQSEPIPDGNYSVYGALAERRTKRSLCSALCFGTTIIMSGNMDSLATKLTFQEAHHNNNTLAVCKKRMYACKIDVGIL